jgi:TDG/mug DNA glycosylase family protein
VDQCTVTIRRRPAGGSSEHEDQRHVVHVELHGELGGASTRSGGAGIRSVAAAGVPMALAELHRALPVGGILDVTVLGHAGGPPFSLTNPDVLCRLLTGAGFTVDEAAAGVTVDGTSPRVVARATRARSLPDTVGPRMRLLVCGLNPSLYAADAGVGYARPGNRFWPAAMAAGLVVEDRDADAALSRGVGLTDLVKRATVSAGDLDAAEYRYGLERVTWLASWLRPGAVCFVGLAGWRAAADRRAGPGVQPGDLGGAPVYVMPSTSGLNARTSLADLTEHLRSAAALADGH